MLKPFFDWFQELAFSVMLRESTWLIPIFDAVHLVALAIFAGAILLVDLRLLGVGLKDRPIAEVFHDAQPWLIGGFSVLFLTGVPMIMGNGERYYYSDFFWEKMVAVVIGIVLTVMVQSSSITTSVLVPLAGAGLITVQQIYPITIGANIGTTVTAMLASLAVSGADAGPARQIAFVHLIFNLLGTLVFYVPSTTRRWPVRLAEGLAEYAVDNKKWAVGYVLFVFYCLPAIIFFLSRTFG